MTVHLIGDTHFGHTNIIRFCNRPFETVHDMNAAMVERWNSVVKPEDLVYHLGDFAFRCKNPQAIGAKLNGTKILIQGNHDKGGLERHQRMGFTTVLEKAVIRHTDKLYLLQHYPIYGKALDEILADNEFHGLIHGHVHNNNGPEMFKGRAINVSVEIIDFTPITLDKVHKEYSKHLARNKPNE